jgi:hypothetical protein
MEIEQRVASIRAEFARAEQARARLRGLFEHGKLSPERRRQRLTRSKGASTTSTPNKPNSPARRETRPHARRRLPNSPPSPDDSTVVGVLAEKTPSGAVPNVYHRQLILGELFGQTIAMTGQAVIGAGDVKQAPDGTVGVHVDEFPEEAALLRWKNYDVLEIERAAARVWRAGLRAVT